VVVNVCFISQVGLRLQRQFHRLDALFVLLKGEESDALLVEHLRVVRVVLQGCVQVIDRKLEGTHVEVATSAILQEVNLVGLGADSLVEVVDGLLEVSERVVAAAQPVVHCWVFIESARSVEVENSFSDEARLQLGDAHVVVGERVLWVDLNGDFEVLNCVLVVAHVLID